MKRLFGTDGIRALAGEPPLDRSTVRKFGLALARALRREEGKTPRVVLGRDTRESGMWLRDMVAIGLDAGNAEGIDAGVITTPGLAHAVTNDRFDAGVMISASHNPYCDNGLKVFSRTGTKLPDDVEQAIEEAILDSGLADPGDRDMDVPVDDRLLEHYLEHLRGVLNGDRPLRGFRLLLDCGNGSASAIAPDLYRGLGVEVESIGDSPDGRNINLDCGSLHLDLLADKVRKDGFDLGIAFDGDADRALAVDRAGHVVDGDYIVYLGARSLKRAGALPGNAVVTTIMSNFWLEKRLDEEGITLHRAAVGDKYVLEMMDSEGLALGGEQSGHIIYRKLATTGDGMLTGILLLQSLLEEQKPLETIRDSIQPFPQVLINVKVNRKPDLRKHPVVGPIVTTAESALAGTGRVVLRYSGTEPLARVMVEAEDENAVRKHAEEIASAIAAELGAP